MKKKNWIWIGALLVALAVIGAVGVTAGYAQGATPNAPLHGRGPGDGHGFGLGQTELEAAAKALGITTDELTTALKSGKTLEQLATDKGVDITKVQDAIKAAHETELRTQIKQAVTDGKMSQDKANWMLEGLYKGYLDAPGFFGFGFGPHGPGFGQPNQTPSAQPTQSSGG